VRLRFTPRAIADIDRIHEYISRRSPRGAANVVARIRDTGALLAMWPGAGQKTNMESIMKQSIGRYPYLIFYSVDAVTDEVVIMHVRHGARRPPKIGEIGRINE
jgi:toxin ParE1/3/4